MGNFRVGGNVEKQLFKACGLFVELLVKVVAECDLSVSGKTGDVEEVQV